ncbi:AI-2E family transporter [Hippea alviniae]|uniref:AI-2E family transporter n=1 Tax=Hippea alviniae TaxID=1279027 RepID=UPI0003B3EC48|nr:AI-2E family transporter [Hippea alviniae]
MRSSIIAFFLIIVTIAFFTIMLPFWKSFVWGITIAIVFYPIFDKIKKSLKNRNIASFLSIIIVLLIIALPITLAVYIMVNETEKFIGNIDKIKVAFESLLLKLQNFSKLKVFAPYIDKIDEAIFSLLQNTGVLITKNIGAIFSQTYSIVANFLFSFIIAFYLIRDNEEFLEYLSNIVDDKEGFYKILKSIRDSINATVLGGVLTALIQGTVGAVGFLIVGLNAFFLWLFLIAMFSFVPLVGTAIIWLPVGIYLFVEGSIVKGIFILVWGVAAIGLVDNYVRPLIISSKINIHPMILFFAILGSVIVFGPIGIILGPVIVSVGDAMVKIYVSSKNKRKLKNL